MNTLLLHPETWDFLIDANGNIAMASDPYAIAQDVASAIRTFLGEVYYDTEIGVPFFTQILGQTPPMYQVASLFQEAALTVPEVTAASCVCIWNNDRSITGQITITTPLDIVTYTFGVAPIVDGAMLDINFILDTSQLL